MDNRTNTIAGWVLAGCGAALGLSILSGMMFHSERPEKMGYPIEGVEAEGGDGGDAVAPIATRSEEHTSELQSLMRISYAVFCLKKKKDQQTTNNVSPNTTETYKDKRYQRL